MPAGRVIGLFHADQGSGESDVDAVDLHGLWIFAEGVGRIYERTELLERLRDQRTRVHDTVASVERVVATIDRTGIELERDAYGRLDGPSLDLMLMVPNGLTAREADVLALMTRGYTNTAIGRELVIADGTVKSHVKQILRKLGASNRTEAIGRVIGKAGMPPLALRK
jgi:DNA-binding NarL/FixJ family response regulator